ncbi:hypothetical protein ABPG73_014783 [Tetrahymena malaccensis]
MTEVQKEINEEIFEHDRRFIEDQENGVGKKSITTAYVPTRKSGATIATGFDLSQHNKYDLKRMNIDFDEIGIPKETQAQLYFYMDKKMIGDVAQENLKKNPLKITEEQAKLIDKKVIIYHKIMVKKDYEECCPGQKFDDLTKIEKSVLLSIRMNTGNIKYFAKGEFLKNFKPGQKCFQSCINILLNQIHEAKGVQNRRRFEGQMLQEEQQKQSVLKQTFLEYLTKFKEIITNIKEQSKKTKNQQGQENQIQNQYEIETIKKLLEENLQQQFNQVFFEQNNPNQINQSLEALKDFLNQQCKKLLKEQVNIDLSSDNQTQELLSNTITYEIIKSKFQKEFNLSNSLINNCKEQNNYQEEGNFQEQDNGEEQKEVNDNDEEQKEDQTNNYKIIREVLDQSNQSSDSMKLLDLISLITKFLANNYTIIEELNEIESEMQEYEKDESQSCKKDDLYDQYKLKYQKSNLTITENEFRKMLNLINEIEKQGLFDSSIFFKSLLQKKNQSKINTEIVIKTQSQQELIDLLNIQPLSNNKLDPIKDRSIIQKNKDLFEQIMNLKGIFYTANDNLMQYIIDGSIIDGYNLIQQQLIKSLKNLDNLQNIFEKKVSQCKLAREKIQIVNTNKEDIQNLITRCNLIKISYRNQQIIGDDQPSFLNFKINDKNQDLDHSSLLKFKLQNTFSLNETNKNNTEFQALNIGIQSSQVADQVNISNKSTHFFQAQVQENKIVNQVNEKNQQYSSINVIKSNNEIDNQTNKFNINASCLNVTNSQTDSKNCKNYLNMNFVGAQTGESNTYSKNSKNILNFNVVGVDDSKSQNVSTYGIDMFNVSITAKSTQKTSFSISIKPQLFNASYGGNLKAFTFNPFSLFNFGFGGSNGGGGTSSKSKEQGKFSEQKGQQTEQNNNQSQYQNNNNKSYGVQFYDFQPQNQIWDFEGTEGSTEGSKGLQNQQENQGNNKNKGSKGSQNQQGNQGNNQNKGSKGLQNQQGNQGNNTNVNTSNFECQKSSNAEYQQKSNSEYFQQGSPQSKNGQYQQRDALKSINSFGDIENRSFKHLNTIDYSERIVGNFDGYNIKENNNNYHDRNSLKEQQGSSNQETQSIRDETQPKNFLNLSQNQYYNYQNQNQSYDSPQSQQYYNQINKAQSNQQGQFNNLSQKQESSIQQTQSIRDETQSKNFLNLSQNQDYNYQNQNQSYNSPQSQQYYNQINNDQSNQQGQFNNISQQQNPHYKKQKIFNQFSDGISNDGLKDLNYQNNFQQNDPQKQQNQQQIQKNFYEQAVSFLQNSLKSYQDQVSDQSLKKINQQSQETKNNQSKEKNSIEDELNILEDSLMKQIEEDTEQLKEINDQSENKNGQKNQEKNDQKKEKDDKKCSCNRRIIFKDSSGRTSFKDGCSCKDKEEKIKKVSGNIYSLNS